MMPPFANHISLPHSFDTTSLVRHQQTNMPSLALTRNAKVLVQDASHLRYGPKESIKEKARVPKDVFIIIIIKIKIIKTKIKIRKRRERKTPRIQYNQL